MPVGHGSKATCLGARRAMMFLPLLLATQAAHFELTLRLLGGSWPYRMNPCARYDTRSSGSNVDFGACGAFWGLIPLPLHCLGVSFHR